MISVDRMPVLVGIDGSRGSDAALDWASTEARTTHRPLHLVHALGTDPLLPGPAPSPAAGRRASGVLIDRAAARAAALAPGTPIIVTVTPGAPSGTLVGLSRDAWTLVVGCRGDGARSDPELGSVSDQVTARAACPVVVVPEPGASRSDGPGVVVGVDGSQPSHEAVGFAVEYASRCGVPLTAVHASPGRAVDEVVPGTQTAPEPAALPGAEQRLVDASLDGWPEKYPDVTVQQRIVQEATVPGLLAQAAGAELLVLGSRGGRGPAGLLLGSVSQGVLRRATCPVAVVRPQATGE